MLTAQQFRRPVVMILLLIAPVAALALSEEPFFKPKNNCQVLNNICLRFWVKEIDPKFTGGNGNWQLKYKTVPLMLLTSEDHDRMRLMAPVKPAVEIKPKEFAEVMMANFDRTLDARYAIYDKVLYAIYVHPLKSLSKPQFESAVRQVASLVVNYGTTYSSGELQYGPSGQK